MINPIDGSPASNCAMSGCTNSVLGTLFCEPCFPIYQETSGDMSRCSCCKTENVMLYHGLCDDCDRDCNQMIRSEQAREDDMPYLPYIGTCACGRTNVELVLDECDKCFPPRPFAEETDIEIDEIEENDWRCKCLVPNPTLEHGDCADCLGYTY